MKTWTNHWTMLVCLVFAGCDVVEPQNVNPVGPVTPQPADSQVAPAPGLPPGARFEQATKNLPPTGNQVELTDSKVALLPSGSYNISLAYRFTTGFPDPLRDYAVQVQFIGAPFYELKIIPGKDLRETGTLQWEFMPPVASGKPSGMPKEFEMSLLEEESRDGRKGYSGKSNTAKGPIAP